MRLSTLVIGCACLLGTVEGASAQIGSFSALPQVRQTPAERGRFSLDKTQLFAQLRASALACPVSMQVRHGLGAGQALAVARGRSGARGGQALDLTIANTGWAGVASMDAVVHFAASKPGLLLLGEDAGGEPLTTPMHIGRRIATGAEIAVSWDLDQSNPVRYVELTRITFSDGSVWSASGNSRCRFVPDPMMLIAGQ